MSGQIKAGLGSLIGNAGEHYVMAELLKRGVIAALAPRNAPGFDILATNGDKTVKIRVKTKTEKYDVWQWSVNKHGIIFRHLSEEDDFTVMVNLTDETRNLDFFIAPTTFLDNLLRKDFQEWLNTPGRGGRPHSPSNPKRNLRYSVYKGELAIYNHNWDLLWEKNVG